MTRILICAAMGCVLFASGLAFAAGTVQWTYSGDRGPEKWAALSPDFEDCAGKNQSPINLTGFTEAELTPIKFMYRADGEEVLNNGHTVQVNIAPGSSILVDGIRFDLLQLHFHAPSENLIEGKSYPMEAHLVHVDENGNLAVVAIMFEEGAENAVLSKMWSELPEDAGETVRLAPGFSAADMLPSDTDYYRFNGSLTTPPCTEGVRWLVIKTPVTASMQQVEAFAKAMHSPNNRPVQPVNARLVLE